MTELHARLMADLTDKAAFDRARDAAFAYIDGLAERPVFPDDAALAALNDLDGPLPETGLPAAEIVSRLDRFGSPATVAQTGGRYFGFVNGGALPATLACRWLTDVWDQNAALGVMSPVTAKLEEITERWLGEVLGLPPGTAVGFVTGSSIAIFCGLAAARWRLLQRAGWDVNARGLAGAPPLRIVTGRQIHGTVVKAIALLGFGTDAIEWVDCDEQGRILVDAVPDLDPRTLLILGAGNVTTGAFDDIAALTARAAAAGAWVHVDGAFGLWAAASRRLAYLTDGLAAAHSWSADGHKTLNTPYDCGLVLSSDREALVAALQAQGSYLQFGRGRDGMLTTPDMSQRARAIEVWAALMSLGRTGVDDLVSGLHDRAREIAAGLEQAGYTVRNDVAFNQVAVSLPTDAQTDAALSSLQSHGRIWVGGASLGGRRVIRVSVCSWATTAADVALATDAFCQARAAAFAAA